MKMRTRHGAVFLETLTISQLVNEFPAFYGPESSLPCSQQPVTCPCTEPPHPPILFLEYPFYILPSTPWSSKWSVPPRKKKGMAEEKEEEENAEVQETSHYARNTAHIQPSPQAVAPLTDPQSSQVCGALLVARHVRKAAGEVLVGHCGALALTG